MQTARSRVHATGAPSPVALHREGGDPLCQLPDLAVTMTPPPRRGSLGPRSHPPETQRPTGWLPQNPPSSPLGRPQTPPLQTLRLLDSAAAGGGGRGRRSRGRRLPLIGAGRVGGWGVGVPGLGRRAGGRSYLGGLRDVARPRGCGGGRGLVWAKVVALVGSRREGGRRGPYAGRSACLPADTETLADGCRCALIWIQVHWWSAGCAESEEPGSRGGPCRQGYPIPRAHLG